MLVLFYGLWLYYRSVATATVTTVSQLRKPFFVKNFLVIMLKVIFVVTVKVVFIFIFVFVLVLVFVSFIFVFFFFVLIVLLFTTRFVAVRFQSGVKIASSEVTNTTTSESHKHVAIDEA